MPSLLKRVAIVGVTAGAFTLAAAPAFAGGPPSHSESSKSSGWSADEHSKWSSDEHSKWSKDEHGKDEHGKDSSGWSDPSGGVETGVGGAAQSVASFPTASTAAALGGMTLIGGGLLARRRRASSAA